MFGLCLCLCSGSSSRTRFGKFVLMPGFFWGGSFSLSVVMFRCRFVCSFLSPFFFVFERQSSGSHRAHPSRTFLVSFLFLVLPPAALVLAPVLRPFFLAFCWGAFLGRPRAFLRFSDSLGTLGGLSLLAPSEALFLDARRQRCSGRFFLLFLFSFFCCVCGFFTSWMARFAPIDSQIRANHPILANRFRVPELNPFFSEKSSRP